MCYNNRVMGKRVKSIVLSVIAAVFGVLALSGPVFATPNNNTEDTNTTTTVENPGDATQENQNETTEETTTETTEESSSTESSTSSTASCYDQVGSLGWIICPGAGLFGNIIDGAYNILSNLIQTDPIPTEQDSPIYITWDYFKNLTNSLFIIFFLIVIFSQITGFGINNYGIKKTLPRIVLAAILVNLSYVLCVLAVDISNILGNSLYGFFNTVQTTAIENGVISSTASSASVSAIIASVLGIGAAGATFAAAVTLGSFEGIIWLLLPILLSGVIAIASAVITMAARQALIFILVIIAPLAIILYMLPNTEKMAKKWFKTFFQMLIFYPAFAVLYGASQLTGLVIISSADSWLTVILGVAVKILPLFMSIPLMRMSGTVLGKIDGIVHRAASPAQRALGGYAASRNIEARQKQLNKQNPRLASTRLAQYLERRRVQREMDIAELTASNKDRNLTRAMAGWYDRNGKVSKRGMRHYQNELRKLENATTRMNIASDFDEGFKHDGTDSRVRRKDLQRIKKINQGYEDAVVKETFAQSRASAVKLSNMESKADRIRNEANIQNSRIHQQILDTFNLDRKQFDDISNKKKAYETAAEKVASGKALTAAEQAAYNAGNITASERAVYNTGQKAFSSTVSEAISAKRKVDRETRSTYLEYYDDFEAGPRIKEHLIDAFQNKDYNSMSAALEVMYKRGDKDDIQKVLMQHSNEVYGDKNIRFQKELNDICITMKGEDIDVAQWAKANMMRRGMHGKGFTVASYIDYDKWAKGETLENSADPQNVDARVGDKDFGKVRKTCRVELAKAMSSWEPIATADRTMWNQMLDSQKDGAVLKDAAGNENIAVFPIKYLRSAVCSGRMDGERLESFNKWFTGGFDDTKDVNGKFIGTQSNYFTSHKQQYQDAAVEFLRDMTAPQLASLKTATIEKLNDMLVYIDQNNNVPNSTTVVNGKIMSTRLLDSLKPQINQLNTERSMATIRTGMNPAVRKMLGIVDIIPSKKP